MRSPVLLLSAALLLACVDSGGPSSGAGSAGGRRARTPVLVELFTSEGCSSCPPADTLLTRLVTDQPIDGVEVVGLSLHVDYWNRLGWVDPFSKPAFTERQNDYATIWGVSRIYTPQAVVDGTREFVGSDGASARAHIGEAAARPKASVDVEIAPLEAGSDRVSLGITVGSSGARASTAHLMLAVAEDGLVSDVRRGENSGRTLAHVAVVRSLTRVAQLDAARGSVSTATLRLEPGWRPDQLRFVAFVQDPVSHAVLGIGVGRLRRNSGPRPL